MRLLLAACCACVLGCATTNQRPPVMEDLRALDKQQNYRELVAHLKDVWPSQRDAEWEALTAHAHAELLKDTPLKTAADAEAALALLEAVPKDFPSLRSAPEWLAARADLGAKAFGMTYANYRHSSGDDGWLPQLKAFAEADPHTAGLPRRLAREVVLGRLVASSAWPLYRLAFEREGDAVCADDRLPAVVMEILSYRSWLAEMKPLVMQRCAAQLKGPVFQKAIKGDDRAFQVATCEMLKGELPAELTKACE